MLDESFEDTIKDILKKLRRKGILMVRIIPPNIAIDNFGKSFESNEENFNWATLQLNIEKGIDELYNSFADRHKGSLKKAIKNNVSVIEIDNEEDIVLFSKKYTEMYINRGLDVNLEDEKARFLGIFNCFQQYKNGFFLAIKNEQTETIGGVCITLQGKSAHYYKGYSSPNFRYLPIKHIAIYKALEKSKAYGKKVFDFGGYALEVPKGDQLVAINFFKEGFRGQKVIFPKTRIYYLIPFVKIAFKMLNKLKTKPYKSRDAN
jgi:lipid II:glycine glycyltransferase (peptidoglycan interpeptide bridge formation enzyme)